MNKKMVRKKSWLSVILTIIQFLTSRNILVRVLRVSLELQISQPCKIAATKNQLQEKFYISCLKNRPCEQFKTQQVIFFIHTWPKSRVPICYAPHLTSTTNAWELFLQMFSHIKRGTRLRHKIGI